MAKETPGLPEGAKAPDSPLKQIFNFLSSMQLGIILLLLLAVISVFATLRDMQDAIRTIYTSWWFVGIMSFTALNLLLCTLERVGPLSRLALKPKRVMSAEEIKRLQVNRAIKLRKTALDPLAVAGEAFRAGGLQVNVSDGPDGPVLFGEKGRLGYFGSIVTHLSLLVILLGAMYGALTGFETRNGGMAGDTFYVPEGNFHATVHSVRMEYLDDAGRIRPRAVSDVSITRNGREIKREMVSINDPLRFEGISIYHSTFLWVAHVEITDPQTGRTEGPVKFLDGDRYALQDKGIQINALAFFPDFTMTPTGQPTSRSYKPNRPVLAYRIIEGGQPLPWGLLELNRPEKVETPGGPVELTLTGFENVAVYSIAKNLGRPYLFAGAVFMVIGLYMSFFLFPRRFWAVFDASSSTLHVGGRGYRNRLGIEQAMERIESEIRQREGE